MRLELAEVVLYSVGERICFAYVDAEQVVLVPVAHDPEIDAGHLLVVSK